MVLLSQMMRDTAFTGSTDSMFTRIVGRQGGRWAEQTVGAAFPVARSEADRAATLHDLRDLRERQVLTDGEFDLLRARLQV